MQTYAVVYYPNKQLDLIETFREKYDSKYKVIPPHITLVFPFSNIEEEKNVHHLHTITKDFNSFSIHLNGLMKSFDNYLFLLVQEGKKEIEKIHEVLYSGILEEKLTTNISFIPHITLGEYSKKAFSEVNALSLDFHYSFDSITLIKGDGVTPATTIQTFPLKASS